jgi:hypothetical protein
LAHCSDRCGGFGGGHTSWRLHGGCYSHLLLLLLLNVHCGVLRGSEAPPQHHPAAAVAAMNAMNAMDAAISAAALLPKQPPG